MKDPNFPIVITTHMREEPEHQKFFYNIPESYRDIVYVFCRESRYERLKSLNPTMVNIVTIPDETSVGIARVRQVVLDKMMELGFNRVWMADDRIRLMRRNDDLRIRTIKCDSDFEYIYDGINELSKQHIMVSLAHRKVGALKGANGVPFVGCKYAGRAYTNYAIQLDKFKEMGISFDGMWKKDNEISLFEDFYVVLSLLTRGIANVLWTDGSFEHSPGYPVGGNSTYRTHELQEKCAYALQREFPQFVKVVQKDASWGDLKDGRVDVQCFWKKALDFGSGKKSPPEESGETNSLDQFFQ